MPEEEQVSTVTTFTDSHAHLEMVAARLGEARVGSILAALVASPSALILDPGVESGDLGRRIALARRLSVGALPEGLAFAAGLWPSREALADPEASMAALEAEMARVKAAGGQVAAIGEGGLDYHHMEAEAATQARLFGLQCALAVRLGLPLVVHSRDAARQTLEVLLAEAGGIPVIIHCFGYGPDEARAFLDAGCFLSFAGNVTYRKAEALREALDLVPADRLLLETDAPYMNPDPFRGKPSTPLDIARTYAFAAGRRGLAVDDLAGLVTANLGGILPALSGRSAARPSR